MTPVRSFHARRGYDCNHGCAFDDPNCRPDLGGFHGIGSLSLMFAVAIPGECAVQYQLFTRMFPRSVDTRWLGEASSVGAAHFHQRAQGVEEDRHKCDLIGGECVIHSEYLLGDNAYDALLAGGDEGLYKWLEDLLQNMTDERG